MANSDEWATRIAEWRRSGDSAEAFAGRLGVTARTLRWWAWKVGSKSPALVRVVRAAAVSAPVQVVIGPARIVVREDSSREALALAVDVLAARSS